MRPPAMIEAIEDLWLDRKPHTLHVTVFDDLMFAEEAALDSARHVHGRDPHLHPLRYVARVVIDDPSRRLLRTGAYFYEGTVLIGGPLGERLVLGPVIADGEVGYLASLEACDCFAGVLRWLFGEEDGIIRVVSFPPDRLLSGRPLPVWPAG